MTFAKVAAFESIAAVELLDFQVELGSAAKQLQGLTGAALAATDIRQLEEPNGSVKKRATNV